MITSGRDFLLLIGGVTNEEALDEGVEAIESVIGDWATQIDESNLSSYMRIVGALYQGALLGLQIAARARAQAAKQLAEDLSIKLEDSIG